jgi:hypothetical protein
MANQARSPVGGGENTTAPGPRPNRPACSKPQHGPTISASA